MPTPFPQIPNDPTQITLETVIVLLYWLLLSAAIFTTTLLQTIFTIKTITAYTSRNPQTRKRRLKWTTILTISTIAWVQVSAVVTLEALLIYKQGSGTAGAGGMPTPTTYQTRTRQTTTIYDDTPQHNPRLQTK